MTIRPTFTWHSGTWPYRMTPVPSMIRHYTNLRTYYGSGLFLPILTLLPYFWGFNRTLQWVRLDNRGRLLLRTSGPVLFGTCISSNVETILSWTYHVYGPFEFLTSLGTFILLWTPSEQRSNSFKNQKGRLSQTSRPQGFRTRPP